MGDARSTSTLGEWSCITTSKKAFSGCHQAFGEALQKRAKSHASEEATRLIDRYRILNGVQQNRIVAASNMVRAEPYEDADDSTELGVIGKQKTEHTVVTPKAHPVKSMNYSQCVVTQGSSLSQNPGFPACLRARFNTVPTTQELPKQPSSTEKFAVEKNASFVFSDYCQAFGRLLQKRGRSVCTVPPQEPEEVNPVDRCEIFRMVLQNRAMFVHTSAQSLKKCTKVKLSDSDFSSAPISERLHALHRCTETLNVQGTKGSEDPIKEHYSIFEDSNKMELSPSNARIDRDPSQLTGTPSTVEGFQPSRLAQWMQTAVQNAPPARSAVKVMSGGTQEAYIRAIRNYFTACSQAPHLSHVSSTNPELVRDDFKQNVVLTNNVYEVTVLSVKQVFSGREGLVINTDVVVAALQTELETGATARLLLHNKHPMFQKDQPASFAPGSLLYVHGVTVLSVGGIGRGPLVLPTTINLAR